MANTRKSKPMLSRVTDFDLKLIRLFKTVSEAGGFAAAESALGISRSAISIHMSDLEKRLGMRLCQRGRGGFSLTDEGAEVLRAADAMLAAIENFRTDVNGINDELRGELNIGIMNNMVTQPQMRMTNALAKLRSLGSGVQVNISMTTPSEIEKGVLDGRFHIGAVPVLAPTSGLDYQVLYEERSCLYCSEGHVLFDHAESVEPEALVDFDAVIPAYRLPNDAMTLNQNLKQAATASDREGIAFLVLTGKYIGYLPDHYAEQWVATGRMRAIRPEHCSYQSELATITRQGRRPNLVLEAFLEAL